MSANEHRSSKFLLEIMTPVSSANITKYLFLETSCLFIIYKLKVMELILGKLHMLTYVTLYVNVYWWLYKKKNLL